MCSICSCLNAVWPARAPASRSAPTAQPVFAASRLRGARAAAHRRLGRYDGAANAPVADSRSRKPARPTRSTRPRTRAPRATPPPSPRRRRRRPEAGSGLSRPRSGRPGPEAETWPSRRGEARARTGGGMGPQPRAPVGARARLASPARADESRAPSQHRLSLRVPRTRSGASNSRRRCLYNWSHGQRGRVRPKEGRRQTGRGRDVRQGDSHSLRRRLRWR